MLRGLGIGLLCAACVAAGIVIGLRLRQPGPARERGKAPGHLAGTRPGDGTGGDLTGAVRGLPAAGAGVPAAAGGVPPASTTQVAGAAAPGAPAASQGAAGAPVSGGEARVPAARGFAPPGQPPPAQGMDGIPTGAIRGVVAFEGPAPARKRLEMRGDPYCTSLAGDATDESVLVQDGKLANVVVHVSSPMPWKVPVPPVPVVVSQKACRYEPRVQAAVAGQTMQIRNDDRTLHNIHAYKGTETIFNQAQVPGLSPIAKTLPGKSEVVKLKCDVHPWMTGYVVVRETPYFAVSGADGAFTLSGVPAGKHQLAAWHERAGTKTADVLVPAGGVAEVRFSFAPADLGP